MISEVISLKQAERAEQTRAKILNAATKLMTTQGFKNTNVREISAVSGISYVTMYKYFSSKYDLISAVMKRIADRHFKLLKKHIDTDDENFIETLNNIRTVSDWIEKQTPPFIRNEFVELLDNPNITLDRAYIEQHVHEIITLVVKSGRRKGFIKTKASDQMIVEVLRYFFFLQHNQLSQTEQQRYELGILLLYGLNGNSDNKKAD